MRALDGPHAHERMRGSNQAEDLASFRHDLLCARALLGRLEAQALTWMDSLEKLDHEGMEPDLERHGQVEKECMKEIMAQMPGLRVAGKLILGFHPRAVRDGRDLRRPQP